MIFIASDFCINPSNEGSLAETYTKEKFMQKQQMIWNLPHHIVWYVMMMFIAN